MTTIPRPPLAPAVPPGRPAPAVRRRRRLLLVLGAVAFSALPLLFFALTPANPELAGEPVLVQRLNRWGVRFTGVWCGVLMCWQLVLMARADVVERAFHRRHLVVLHAVLGVTVPVLLVVHVGVRVVGLVTHPEVPGAGPARSVAHFLTTGPAYVPAVAAAFVLLVVAGSCVPRARRRLRRVRWHRLHLLAYAAAVAALPHEFAHGTTFGAGGAVTTVALAHWVLLTSSALSLAAWYRLVVPARRNREFPLRVVRSRLIGQRGEDRTWEVVVAGSGAVPLSGLGLRPGQHLVFTVGDPSPRTGWLTGRAWTPTLRDDRLLLTVGLHRSEREPRAGDEVLFSGPFGRLTPDELSPGCRRVLLAVSGTGVAAARALAGDLLAHGLEVTVVHRVPEGELPVWREEFERLGTAPRLRYLPLVDRGRREGSWLPAGEEHDVTPEQWLSVRVDRVDLHEAFVVGSPTWVRQVRATLLRLRVPRGHVHVE